MMNITLRNLEYIWPLFFYQIWVINSFLFLCHFLLGEGLFKFINFLCFNALHYHDHPWSYWYLLVRQQTWSYQTQTSFLYFHIFYEVNRMNRSKRFENIHFAAYHNLGELISFFFHWTHPKASSFGGYCKVTWKNSGFIFCYLEKKHNRVDGVTQPTSIVLSMTS